MNFSLRDLYGKLRRVTASGTYLPSLDGLRFFAILWVVFYHLHGSFSIKASDSIPVDADSWLSTIMVHGRQGVPLFFVISGFILCLPFARHYLLKGKAVELKAYYVRRLVRIGFPYYIATLVLVGLYVLLGKYTLDSLLPHAGATLIYMHTILFKQVNIINVVFWTLEVEIQFYILAPLLIFSYFVLPTITRRLAVLALILVLPVFQIDFAGMLPFTLLNYIQYFLAGFLICDLYLLEQNRFFRTNIYVPVVVLPLILFTTYDDSLIEGMLYPFFIILLYLSVLFNPLWGRVFSWRPLAAIGGISYSIFLIHFPIIGFFGEQTMKVSITNNYYVNLGLQCMLLLPLVLILSSVFYFIAEKPFMKLKFKRQEQQVSGRVVEANVKDTRK
jgi:peptidoglycan/LPS O-acetylase OafA/YrhL